MLVVIDGTGDWLNKSYESQMMKGFINKIKNESYHTPSQYFRGPSLTGIESAYIVAQIMNWIRQNLNNGYKPELYLAGYSRGGSIAIEVAGEIANIASVAGLLGDGPWSILNRNIQCMALFDAVDRSYLDTKVIPSNVKRAYHAIRDKRAGSRRSFSNTGLEHATGYIEKQEFLCTHGAMGGLPWAGDHPTRVVGHQLTIPIIKKTLSYRSKFDNSIKNEDSSVSVLDIFRDELNIPIGTEITEPLITEAQDKANSKAVWDWMYPLMSMSGMFSHSGCDLNGNIY